MRFSKLYYVVRVVQYANNAVLDCTECQYMNGIFIVYYFVFKIDSWAYVFKEDDPNSQYRIEERAKERSRGKSMDR